MSKRGTPERTKRALREAIEAVDQAIAEGVIVFWEPGPHAVSQSREELLRFKGNLQRMLDDVVATESDTGPVQRQPVGDLGRIIADVWPTHLAVGEKILGAEHEYKAFLKRREWAVDRRSKRHSNHHPTGE